MSPAKPDVPCPRCKAPLSPVREGGDTLGICSRCRGLLVHIRYLQKELHAEPASFLRPLRSRGRSVECSRCHRGMLPHETVGGSPIVIDYCAGCSLFWLDRAELPALRMIASRLGGSPVVVRDVPEDDPEGPDPEDFAMPKSLAIGVNDGSMGEFFFALLSGIPVERWVAAARTPLWTYGLIAVNVAVMVWVWATGADIAALALRFGAIPRELIAGADLATTLSYPFLHADVFHLAGNIYFLWVFGDNVEDAFGRLAFPLFYVVAGTGAIFAQALAYPSAGIPVIGASGAVSGLMGAYLVLYPAARMRVRVFWNVLELPCAFYILFWVGLQLLLMVFGIPGVAFVAHLGGAAVGVAAGFMYRARVLPRLRRRRVGG